MGIIRLDRNRVVDYCDRIIEISFYTLLFCLPFSTAIIEIAATFAIVAWLTKKAFERQLASTYLDIPITMYVIAVLLSVIFSSNFGLSFKNFFTKTMEYIFLYFIVAEFVCDRRRLKNTVIFMLVSAAMIGLDCIFQYFFNFDFLRFRALEAGRISGSFHMPGDLAGFLGPILCLFLSLSFLRLEKYIKYFLRIGSILLLALLIASFARGVWVGFMFAVLFLGILEKKRILYITVAFLLILGIVLSHLIASRESILDHLRSIVLLSDAASLDRKAIWEAALEMIKDKPIFGHGLSTFMGNFSKYGKDYFHLKYGVIPYAHNCYLQIAAETGIVGLVSFLTLIGTFFIYTIIYLRKIKDRFYHAVLTGISAGLIVTLVHSFVDTNLYSLQLSVLFWVMLGLNAALQRDFIFEKTAS